MESILLIIILTITIIFLLLPFLRFPKERLSKNISSMNQEELLERKRLVLKRYLVEEEAFNKQQLSKRVWYQRKEFLLHRYMDISRRLEWIRRQGDNLAVFFLVTVCSVLGFCSELAFAGGCQKGEELDVSHAMILDPAVEQVFFSYWVQISNPNKCLIEKEISLYMPKQIKEWKVQESKLPSEAFRVGEDGAVRIMLKAPPDFKEVISLLLRAEFPKGIGKLDFVFDTFSLKNLVLLLPKQHEKIKIGGDFLMIDEVQLGRTQMLQFQVTSGERPASTLEVVGVQLGRSQTHTVLYAGAGVLVLLMFFAFWRTRF